MRPSNRHLRRTLGRGYREEGGRRTLSLWTYGQVGTSTSKKCVFIPYLSFVFCSYCFHIDTPLISWTPNRHAWPRWRQRRVLMWDIPEGQTATERIGRRTIDLPHRRLCHLWPNLFNSNEGQTAFKFQFQLHVHDVHPLTPMLVGHLVTPGYQEPKIRMHD